MRLFEALLRIFQAKTTVPAKKVWRISESAPMGEWVNKAAPVAPKPSKGFSSGGWVRSSHDLLDGTDVTENPDTLPGVVFDELLAPKQDASKKSGQ